MHKKILRRERKELSQELTDINSMKYTHPKEYDEAEDILDKQDRAIRNSSARIHRLRSH